MRRADTSPLHKRAKRPRPIRSRSALEMHLATGGRIRKTLPRIDSESVVWQDPATDRTISRSLVQWAFEQGKLRGCGDGLFDDTHQTYEGALKQSARTITGKACAGFTSERSHAPHRKTRAALYFWGGDTCQ